MYIIIHHHPILIQVYPSKKRWSDLPQSNSNLSNSHSPSRSIQGILLLQTNTLALLLHLCLPLLLLLLLVVVVVVVVLLLSQLAKIIKR